MSNNMQELIIARRFCGPPNSGNGGYSAGLLNNHIAGTSRVRLHLPPPLDKPLRVTKVNGEWLLQDGNQLVASARPAPLNLVPPAPPSIDQARRAEKFYRGLSQHRFPSCFVCGPDRQKGDGLRLFCGSVEGREIVACGWQPQADLLDKQNNLKHEFIWSALDCPSYFALKSDKTCLLGEMSASVDKPVPGNQPLIIYAWQRSIDGRKHYSASAISSCDGEVLARAEHLWIEVQQ